jgi:phage terminase large subunit
MIALADFGEYHAFRPRPDNPAKRDHQTGFVNDTSTVSICLGGNGSGKTYAAAFKTARYVRETMPKGPNWPFWVVGEKKEQVCQVAWVEKLSLFIPPEWILHIDWYRPNRSWPNAVVLRNRLAKRPNEAGWVLEFRSYEQNVDAFKGTAIGGFWLNEEAPFELLTEIRRGCRETNAPGWADFTPVKVKSPEWPKAYKKPPKGMTFWHLNTMCNDKISEDWKEEFFDAIPEEFRAMRQHGDFLGVAGAVFSEFDAETHVIEPFDIPDDWPRWRACDFGFNNPFCCLWLAKGYDGTIYIYDEHYGSGKLLEEHATAIKSRTWIKGNPYYGPTVTDHDAQVRGELSALGIACTLANKNSVVQSIEVVKSKMKVRGDNRPRLQIFNTCENLLREIPMYRWKEGTEDRSAREEPNAVDDHAIDAMRYGIMWDFDRNKGFNVKGYKSEITRQTRQALGVQ